MAKKGPKDQGQKPPPIPSAPGAAAPPGQVSVGDVDHFPVADPATAARVKAAAGVTYGPRPPPPPPGLQPELAQPELAVKPGKERWPVKTGTDPDVQEVAPRIVPTTVEEMISIPRPRDMNDPSQDYSAYQEHRAQPVETTVWQLDAEITALKQEADGDYHLVLQGESGETMIAEIPTPRPPFVKAQSPWLAAIKAARQAVDAKLVSKLSPTAFAPLAGKLVPRASVTALAAAEPVAVTSFVTPDQGTGPAFKTRIPPTRARITGVGFFDRVHGQMGVSQSNGIELHPVLKIEWLDGKGPGS